MPIRPMRSRHDAAAYKLNFLASVFVVSLRTTSFYGLAHIVEYKERERPQALPLFGTKCFIEWLPRFGELVQIG